MTALVIDSSVILASLFEEERTPKVLAIRRRVGTDGALVPTLWVLEIATCS